MRDSVNLNTIALISLGALILMFTIILLRLR